MPPRPCSTSAARFVRQAVDFPGSRQVGFRRLTRHPEFQAADVSATEYASDSILDILPKYVERLLVTPHSAELDAQLFAVENMALLVGSRPTDVFQGALRIPPGIERSRQAKFGRHIQRIARQAAEAALSATREIDSPANESGR